MSLFARFFANIERFVERLGHPITISGLHATLDARRIDFNTEKYSAIQRRRQRLRAAHSAEPARQQKLAAEIATKMLVSHRGKRFEGSLHDALRADVNPTARSHLPVHHQAFTLEFVKMIPIGPGANQIRICN